MPEVQNEEVTFRSGVVEAMPALRNFALKLTRNAAAADDLVQETVVRALLNREKFEPGTNLSAWLFTIQRNLFLSSARRDKRLSFVDMQDPVWEPALVAKPDQDRKLILADTLRILNEMEPRFAQALALIVLGDLSYDEAADEAGVPVGTIKSRVSRLRKALEGRT